MRHLAALALIVLMTSCSGAGLKVPGQEAGVKQEASVQQEAGVAQDVSVEQDVSVKQDARVDGPPGQDGGPVFHPGHYILVMGEPRAPITATGGTSRATLEGWFTSQPKLQGIMVQVTWKDIETSKGVYDISFLTDANGRWNLQWLNGLGKHLILMVQNQSYGGPSSYEIPSYLYDGGPDSSPSHWYHTPNGNSPVLWTKSPPNDYVVDRFAKAIEAALDQIKASPGYAAFEGFYLEENAVDFQQEPEDPVFDATTFAENMSHILGRVRAKIGAGRMTGQMTNQYRTQFQPLWQANGWGFGRPNLCSSDSEASSSISGTLQNWIKTSAYPKSPINMSPQGNTYGIATTGKQGGACSTGTATFTKVLAEAKNMHVHYMTWQARSGDPEAAFDLSKVGADGFSVLTGLSDTTLAPGPSGGLNTVLPSIMQ